MSEKAGVALDQGKSAYHSMVRSWRCARKQGRLVKLKSRSSTHKLHRFTIKPVRSVPITTRLLGWNDLMHIFPGDHAAGSSMQ